MSQRQKQYAELIHRRQLALAMGGAARIDKQHAKNKLTVRERIDAFLDADTFCEYGQLATHAPGPLVSETQSQVTPADGFVFGFGAVDGRPICIGGEDFTVKGGTYGVTHGAKKRRAVVLASQERVPIVLLLDGAGARAQEMIGEGLPTGPHYFALAKHSGIAPTVGIVMGPSAGDSSLLASLCQFIVMVDKTSMLAAGGPPVVKAATGQDIDKETLGGADVHCTVSGVADNRATDEQAALLLARRFLSYFPTNAWQYPPERKFEAPGAEDTTLLDRILPDEDRLPYDMKRLIDGIIDKDSFLEIKPEHAPMIVCGLGTVEGHPVGVIANQPLVQAGAITAAAARKARHFIDLCSSFHLPLVFIQDVPGVMPGVDSEREGALRPALSLAYAIAMSSVPKITLIVRKAFGYGACAMAGGGADHTAILAWPSAVFASLPATSAIETVHKAQIEESNDPEKTKRQLMDYYEQCSGSMHAAGIMNIDDVILPSETRGRIAHLLSISRARRSANASPPTRTGVMP